MSKFQVTKVLMNEPMNENGIRTPFVKAIIEKPESSTRSKL